MNELAELPNLQDLRFAQRQAELEHAGADVSAIWKCLPEATLFFNGQGRAMTAWRWQLPDHAIEILYESDWRAEPSEHTTSVQKGAVLVSGDDLEFRVPAVLGPEDSCTENP